jgi:hypothetical protein
MTPGQFLAKWTAEADAMHRRGVMVNGAGLCSEILTDFRAVMASQGEFVLSLPEAAARSGYTAEHLGRMVRDGRISNAGRRGAPRIRAADLPRKPPALVPSGPRAYDPSADARTLLDRQRGDSNG